MNNEEGKLWWENVRKRKEQDGNMNGMEIKTYWLKWLRWTRCGHRLKFDGGGSGIWLSAGGVYFISTESSKTIHVIYSH